MTSCIARQSFQFSGQIDQRCNILFCLVTDPQQLFLFQRAIQCHVQFKGDQLRDLIHKPVGVPQNPAHIPDHSLGCHTAEGDDLGYPFTAIALRHVFDNLVTSIHAEIHVKIR